MKKMQIRMVFSPPPQTALFYLGPIMIDSEKQNQHKREITFEKFQKSLDSYLINDLKANYISISLPPGLSDPRPFSWGGYTVEPAYDYIRNINYGIDYEWQNIPRKVRQNIYRAKSRGISVTQGDKRDLESIITLMKRRYETSNRQVTVPTEYLFDLYDYYSNNIKIFSAWFNGEIISGVVSIIYKNCLYSWIGNPKTNSPVLPSPNDMLIWEEIKFCCMHGMNHYITLSAAGNERLHTYYSSKMNADLQIRFTVKRHSFTAGIMERLYSGMLKPMNEKLH